MQPRVPAATVLPLEAVTVNLFVFTDRFPVAANVPVEFIPVVETCKAELAFEAAPCAVLRVPSIFASV